MAVTKYTVCKINIFVLVIINKGNGSIIEYKEWCKYCILHVILMFILDHAGKQG